MAGRGAVRRYDAGAARRRVTLPSECPTPSTSANADARAPASGAHDRRAWIRLLATCRARELSGLLVVSQGRRTRTLSVVGGRPVHFDSDVPEDDLSRTLVVAGLVPSDRLQWLQGRLGDGESLQGALVMSGAIERDQLAAHRRDRLRMGVLAPLQWGSGTWRFCRRRGLDRARIDPRLLPDVHTLAVLASEIGVHVDLDTAMADLEPAGVLRAGPALASLFDELALPATLADLPTALASGGTVSDLMGRFPAGARALPALLWMLRAAGLVIGEDGEDTDLADALEAAGAGRAPVEEAAPAPAPPPIAAPAAPRRASTPSAPPAPDPASAPSPAPAARGSRSVVPVATVLRMVQSDHADRRGRDAYAFLDLGPDADEQTIKRAATRLARRWKAAERDTRLPSVARGQARELLRALAEVRLTLLDADKKLAYDIANGLTEPAAPPSPAAEARDLMAAGAHKKALALLSQLRQEHPSDPEVLSDLGWATWMVRRGEPKGVEEAEEYLQLALTFEPRHVAAHDRIARIALARGDAGVSRKRLERLLKVDPSAEWAKEALEDIAAEEARNSGGIGSWLRGGRS